MLSLSTLQHYIAWTRKAIIQVLGLATSLLTLGLLPDEYNKWVASAVGVLTIVLHFITPNAPAPGEASAIEVPEDEDDESSAEVVYSPDEVTPAGQVAAEHEQAAPLSPTTQ